MHFGSKDCLKTIIKQNLSLLYVKAFCEEAFLKNQTSGAHHHHCENHKTFALGMFL